MNVWLEPRFTADGDVTLIADRPKDQVGLLGLARLPGIDWPYVERWAAEWQVLDRLQRIRTEPPPHA